MSGTSLAVAAGLALVFALAMTAVTLPRPGRSSRIAWPPDGARGATTGRAATRGRNVFVVSQVAMALVLTVGAGLLASSYVNLARVDLGYRPADVLTLTLTPRDGVYAADAPRRTAYRARACWRRGAPRESTR